MAVSKVAVARSKASRSGSGGEAIVGAFHREAERRGLARLFHVPTPTRWTKGKAGMRLVYAGKSVVDTVGFELNGRARFIAEEIKTTQAHSFRIAEVEPHQRAFLDIVDAAGGVAVLTVVWSPDKRVSVLCWRNIRDLSSLSADVLAGSQVSLTTYLEDQCAVARKAA